jgi:hypothetical protein
MYALTCGHLGVPCAGPAARQGHRRAKAAGARRRKAAAVGSVGR